MYKYLYQVVVKTTNYKFVQIQGMAAQKFS